MLSIDLIATVLEMISESFITLLIFMLANGWMTRFSNFGSLDDNIDNFETYVPAFVLVLMAHLIFGFLTYVDMDSHHKYHDFHGWVGFCMIALKFGMVIIFYYFYSEAKKHISKGSEKFYMKVC